MDAIPNYGLGRILTPKWYWRVTLVGWGFSGAACVTVGTLSLSGLTVFEKPWWIGFGPLGLGLMLFRKSWQAMRQCRNSRHRHSE